MRIWYWWTSSLCRAVLEGCVCLQIITGEFFFLFFFFLLEKRIVPSNVFQQSHKHGCPACSCQTLVAMSSQNMTNHHGNVVRKARHRPGLLDCKLKYLGRKVDFSRSSQTRLKGTFEILCRVLLKLWNLVDPWSETQRSSGAVLMNHGSDGDEAVWPPPVSSTVRSSLIHTRLCCRSWSDGFLQSQFNGISVDWASANVISHTWIEYKSFTCGSKTHGECFD